MTRRIVIAALGSAAFAQKKPAPPEVELLEATAGVEEQRVNIDGRVRNTAQKPIRKLVVVYEILDPANNVLTRQQGPIEEPVLDLSDEARFAAQLAWHARSHAFRLFFEDGSGRELRAENTGPFPIE